MNYQINLEQHLVEARRHGYGNRVRQLTKMGVGNTLAEKQAKGQKPLVAKKAAVKKAAAKKTPAKKTAPAKKTVAKKTTTKKVAKKS